MALYYPEILTFHKRSDISNQFENAISQILSILDSANDA